MAEATCPHCGRTCDVDGTHSVAHGDSGPYSYAAGCQHCGVTGPEAPARDAAERLWAAWCGRAVPESSVKSGYRVAAHFGAEGYGGVSEFDSREDALRYRDHLLSNGYPAAHVWRVTITRIAGFAAAAMPGEGEGK
jgi:hypothetical protein